MEKNKYKIQYSEIFKKDMEKTLRYITYDLKNNIVAESMLQKVEKAIKDRSENPEAYEKYASSRKRKNAYYRIYVKKYIIFYVVKGNIMEVRRILHSKRDFDKLI